MSIETKHFVEFDKTKLDEETNSMLIVEQIYNEKITHDELKDLYLYREHFLQTGIFHFIYSNSSTVRISEQLSSLFSLLFFIDIPKNIFIRNQRRRIQSNRPERHFDEVRI